MKVLLLISRPIYPLNGGDRVRVDLLLRLAKSLGETNVIASLLWFEKFEKTKQELAKQKIPVYEYRISPLRLVINILISLLGKLPIQNSLYRTKALLERDLSQYDIVFHHLSRTHRIVNVKEEKSIIDLTDNLLIHYNQVKFNWTLKSLFFLIEKKRIQNYYNSLSPKSTYSFISKRDRLNENDLIIRNDCCYVCNLHSKDSKNILFIGNMLSYPNQQAIKTFVKLNTKFFEKNKFQLFVLGRGSVNIDLEKKGWIKTIESYKNLKNLNIKFRFGVAPMLSGAGLQNKVLDYIKHAIPAIVTSITEEAFPKNNKLIFREDNISKYGEIIQANKVLDNLESIAEKYISSEFSFENIKDKIDLELSKKNKD